MFEGGRNDIEKAIELLKTINQNMKVDHMMKDMWEGATEEETREYIENFGLINIAISTLEKTSDEDCSKCKDRNYCAIRSDFDVDYCSDWSVEE